jgi:hypothetical protein
MGLLWCTKSIRAMYANPALNVCNFSFAITTYNGISQNPASGPGTDCDRRPS